MMGDYIQEYNALKEKINKHKVSIREPEKIIVDNLCLLCTS